ncbi:MSMEG_1061 family FMN-dependent PPOX-type flavoprotein [Streptomyces sp. SID3343]|uniref:MSMEG_1061 family FMN-dependent PPOX-type flavoprotein n=1 Tax=Streptomyces sp. SID3343 TaxID=2690260 RepID=UPI001371C24F|nr:MSMEG_1061 family FMN-dependent PPOX-type flavoprotein [Streptomyces sp. SID3343]MYW01615.1 pyridoxamine 5'-phosphate oxidase family protein [Streptomyces sp. SID3343]
MDPTELRYRRLTPEKVRALIGNPAPMAKAKKLDRIDAYFHRFIAHSPFVSLATADATGLPDSSPRGDYPGFVKVLDERTLAMPDRPGNKLADSFDNLAENDGVGLLFLVPGVREVLRVNGRAYPSDEPDVLARMHVEGKAPPMALIIKVVEAYFHCGRALIRSRLWDPDSQALADEIPSVGEAAVAQLGLDLDAAVIDRAAQDSYRTLY